MSDEQQASAMGPPPGFAPPVPPAPSAPPPQQPVYQQAAAVPGGTGYAPPPAIGSAAVPPPQAAPPTMYQQVVQIAQAKTNGLAIASLVLGILWVYWIGSVLAVIFGHVALSQIDKSGGTQTGRGMAIAGLVLGWIGVGVLLIILVAAGGAGA
jgi:hypothetical protein